MKKYVAYYRVSTQKQGVSGLGLEAQKESVRNFIGDNELLAEYKEVESGRKNYRPKLYEAIEFAKEEEATLVIARLDRLSRNAAFTMALRDSGVDFVAADIPGANTLTIGVLALVSQTEAERISKNTKAALQQLKKNGVKLGSPQNLSKKGREKSIQVRREKAMKNDANKKAYALIKAYEGSTLWDIAKKLNQNGFTTSQGYEFTPTQVARIKKLYEN